MALVENAGLLVPISIFLPLGAGVVKWHAISRSLKLLTVVMLYFALNDLIMLALASRSVKNIFMIHGYVIIVYVFLAFLFSYWHQDKPKRLIRASVPAFIAFYLLLLATGRENLGIIPAISHSVMSISLTLIALYTLLSILKSREPSITYRDERFWVSIGVMVQFSGNVMIFSGVSGEITITLWTVHNFLFLIGYLCYLGAYPWKCSPTTY